jgi:iron complex outermembrane receptor protein
VYNYNDRYLLTANFRRDGSSKFGPNNRWGNFPSIALGWRASNEKFLKQLKWLDNLKLRLSYGYTGNQENLPPNSYQILYAPAGPYLFNGQVFQSYAVNQENNPDLKWEVRKAFNIGVDFSLLENRINGSIDAFNDKTSDMLFLYDIPQPPFLTNKVYANAASAVNKGVEINLGAVVIKTNNFQWEMQTNFATLRNHITNLLGQFKGFDLSITGRHYGYVFGGAFGSTYATELKVGYPAGVFWIPEHARIDAGGHELFNNYDSTGKITGTSTTYTDKDRVYIDPTPRFTWGFTNTFAYGNFDLSFFLRGVQGQKIFANSILFRENINNLPGSNVTEKALTNGFKDLNNPSTYWLRDGTFTRLENITLGYNFKNLRGVSGLRIYITAINLFVITSYEGIDPEISTDGSQRYIDASYYPKTRGFTFGVNAGF